MIRVLIVEDSPTQQALLRNIVEHDTRLEVAGVVGDGQQAVEFVQRTPPDLVLMDIHMPRMNGLEATRRIMAKQPVPIIIVSSSTLSRDVDWTFEAIAAGALTFMTKPHGPDDPNHAAEADKLNRMIVTMAGVKVIRRVDRSDFRQPAVSTVVSNVTASTCKLIAVGSSTGGPPALQLFLKNLPSVVPVPIVIVQHMTPGFLGGLADWLHKTTLWPISIGKQDELPRAGHVYFAPDGVHLELDGAGRLKLVMADPEYGVRPAVARLFRSVAQVHGAGAIGVLLTGMGADGAEELLQMRKQGALTYAQDKESSVVHGMPGEAIRLNAAQQVLPPDRIAEHIASMLLPK